MSVKGAGKSKVLASSAAGVMIATAAAAVGGSVSSAKAKKMDIEKKTLSKVELGNLFDSQERCNGVLMKSNAVEGLVDGSSGKLLQRLTGVFRCCIRWLLGGRPSYRSPCCFRALCSNDVSSVFQKG